MYTIFCDVPVARRRRVHHLFDDRGQLRVTSPDLGDLIRWAFDHGESSCYLDFQDWRLAVVIDGAAMVAPDDRQASLPV